MDMGTIEMFKCLINNTKYNNYNINHFYRRVKINCFIGISAAQTKDFTYMPYLLND